MKCAGVDGPTLSPTSNRTPTQYMWPSPVPFRTHLTSSPPEVRQLDAGHYRQPSPPYLLSSHHTLDQLVSGIVLSPITTISPTSSGSPGRDDVTMAVDGQVRNCSARSFRRPTHTTIAIRPTPPPDPRARIRFRDEDHRIIRSRWDPPRSQSFPLSRKRAGPAGHQGPFPSQSFTYNPPILDRTRRLSRSNPHQPTHSYHYKYSLRSPSTLSGTLLFLSFSAVTSPPFL